MTLFKKYITHNTFFPEADDQAGSDGRILFKKPVKNASSEAVNVTSSSSRKEEVSLHSKSKKRSDMKQVKNSSLLSFDDADEEADDE